MGEIESVMHMSSKTHTIKPALLLFAVLCCACSFGQTEDIVQEDAFSQSPSTQAIREHVENSPTELSQEGYWRRRRRFDREAHAKADKERSNKNGERSNKNKERGNKEKSNKRERSNKNQAKASKSKNQKNDLVVWKPHKLVGNRYLERQTGPGHGTRQRFYEQWKGNRKTGQTKWVYLRKEKEANKFLERSTKEVSRKKPSAPGKRRRAPVIRGRDKPRTPAAKQEAETIYRQQLNRCDACACGYGCNGGCGKQRRRRQCVKPNQESQGSGTMVYSEETLRNVRYLSQKRCDAGQCGYGCNGGCKQRRRRRL